MDTGKEYIKMCIEATEIHRHLQPTIGWFKEGIWYHNNDVWYQPPKDSDIVGMILLHRQDQLQDMIKYPIWFEVLFRFYEWIQKGRDDGGTVFFDFTSMEQLWLGFLMKNKFNKVWDKNKWIKKN